MLVIGAGGFAKQLLDVFEQIGENVDLVFFDDISINLPEKLYNKFIIVRSFAEAEKYFENISPQFCLGIGDPNKRKKLADKFSAIGGELKSVISPLARVGKYDVKIAPGVTILTGSIIENGVHIGKGSLINLNCTITHDCVIGDFCEISPGVHLSGKCKIGNYCFIGTGAVLLPRVKIGDNAIIGAGAVVTKNVPSEQTVVGVPAKEKR